MSKGKLHRIVLTGGPCAGKTTALSHAREHLEKLGIKVFIVPEVATLAIGGGIDFNIDPEDYTDLQKDLLQLQLKAEDVFLRRAQQACAAGYNAAIIFDRGTSDFAAYSKPDVWKAMLDELGMSQIGLRDKRYDGVVHMVTAADGAVDHYINTNVRNEGPEQARELDKKVLEAWLGHPHLTIIKNEEGGFDQKIRRVVAALSRIVGIPEPLEIERRFLVKNWDLFNKKLSHWDITYIEQAYVNPGHRIRKRGKESHYVYTETVKREIRPGVRHEEEWQIDMRQYFSVLRDIPAVKRFDYLGIRPIINKARTVMLWEHQVLEMDTFNNPCSGMSILEIETATEDTPIVIPSWIDIEKEVTNDDRYSNCSIAMNRIVIDP